MTEAQELGTIVVGVDGSVASKRALQWAQRLAPTLDATLEVVIAWDFPTTYGWPVAPGDWRPDADAEKVVQDVLDEVLGTVRPEGLKTVVTRGNPRDVLLSASEGATMLVVGSRGHGGFAGLLLGSVSAACVEHSRCPVLVVHADPA